MKGRLEAAERILKLRKEQDLQLRDSIFMATREVCIIVRMTDSFFSHTLSLPIGTASTGCICYASATAGPATRLKQPQY